MVEADLNIDLTKENDVFGIGNAIIDLLIEVNDDLLEELKINKGQFRGVGEKESEAIIDKVGKTRFKQVPGGSAANVTSGIAKLGGKAVFCGKVGLGSFGAFYENQLSDDGVKTRLAKSKIKTGRAITFITPDSERSFAAYLGAAAKLTKEDIAEEDIKNSKILHIEGYKLDNEFSREMVMHAIGLAKKHGALVSVDLNDARIIKENHESFKNIASNHMDIIFVNELEAEAFTGKKNPVEALDVLSEYAPIAVVKNGLNGSFIKHNGIIYNIPAYKANAIDTTGAGDMYAAGFLYGLCNGYDLQKCGNLGSFAASKVVEQVGARYDGDLKGHVNRKLFKK